MINGHSSSTQVKTLKDCLDKHDRDAATDMVKGFKDEKARTVAAAPKKAAEEVKAAVKKGSPALGWTSAFGGPRASTSLASSRVNLLTQIDELHLTRQELTTPLLTTTRYSPLTTHYSLLTTHHSPLTTRTQIEEEVMTGANFRDRLVRCKFKGIGDSYTWGLVESVEKTDDAISLKVNRPN